jgi:acetyl-CoA acyltransferase
MFARRAKAYKAKWGVTDADIAAVVVKAYANANKNPDAHMHTQKRNLEWATASDKNPVFLANEDYRDHLKVGDCSQVSDGGSAVILATEAGLAKLGIPKSKCVEILSYAVSTAALGKVEDLTVLENTGNAARQAYADAEVGAKDIQVAEVHDCFSVTEVMMVEALGFAEPGKGTDLVKSGATAIEGSIPVNTGGGLIAFGHPVGATGVKQVIEIHKQLKGRAGDYQVPGKPKLGLTANMGGDDRTSVVMIFKDA